MNRAERRRAKSLGGRTGGADGLLHDAARHHRAGEFAEAEAAYRAFLALEPKHSQALHLLGLVCHQTGRNGEAAALIAAAEQEASSDPEIPYNLGNALLLDGRAVEAVEAFRRALALRPGRPDALNNLGNALQRLGRIDEAVRAYQQALDREPGRLDTLSNLGHALQALGRFEEAVATYRQLLARDPTHATALHMVAAMTGELPPAAPDEFVRRLFDGYADRFESHLTVALAYDPGRFVDLLRRTAGDRRFARAIDLGCGTGLAGPMLRPIVDHLTGVDLSPAMLAKAEAKGVYDHLAAAGIEPFLSRADGRFDLFFAADVFVYVGALDGVFAAAAARAAPGAWFAFSVESDDGDGFTLRPTGRYAHSLAYLDRSLSGAGWRLAAAEPVAVRTDRDVPIPGQAIVAHRA